jgi:hypothetical protein
MDSRSRGAAPAGPARSGACGGGGRKARRDQSGKEISRSGQSVKRLKMSVIFCPPNPKLLDRATSIVCSRASWGM